MVAPYARTRAVPAERSGTKILIPDKPLRSWKLFWAVSDHVEPVGEKGGEFCLPEAQVAEEGVDGGSELGERRVVGVPERLILEEPP